MCYTSARMYSKVLPTVQVLQHFADQIIGRDARADPTQSEGVLLLKTPNGDTKGFVYTLAMYALPLNTAEVAAALKPACSHVFHRQICVDHHGRTSMGSRASGEYRPRSN